MESTKTSELTFDYIHLLCYECHKTNSSRGGSYIVLLIGRNKKGRINLINKKDNKCLEYALTVVFSHEEIGKHAKKITKIE